MIIKFLCLIMLMVSAGYSVSYAVSQEKPAGEMSCEEITANINELKSEYDANYKEQKKAFENWQKYYKQLHSFSYEDTDKPLMDSYEKCKGEDYQGKDFCKGVFENYDQITAKEEPAKQAYDSAELNTNESRQKYKIAVRSANKMGCNPKK